MAREADLAACAVIYYRDSLHGSSTTGESGSTPLQWIRVVLPMAQSRISPRLKDNYTKCPEGRASTMEFQCR